jgi:opacity protein-like surface antigen
MMAGLLWSLPGLAQPPPDRGGPKGTGALSGRTGYINLGLAAGYMFEPDMPMGLISLDYFVTDEIAVGPYFHVGGAGRNKFWALSGQVRYSPSLSANPAVRPYGMLGIGFGEMTLEKNDRDDDLVYFFPVGGGMEFELTDILTLEVGGLFEISKNSFAGLTVGVKVIL